MTPSSRKVGKELFEPLMKKGVSYTSESFSAKVFVSSLDLSSKFSVVVAKKLEKSAVLRNVYKRRFYSLLRTSLDKVKTGVVCAIFLKKKISAKDLPALTLELGKFLDKSKILLNK